MIRRTFLMTLAGGLMLAMPAFAAFSDDVIRQLVRQGYANISVTRTWLGRDRILAHRDGGVREIVLNPNTGEILRDLWTDASGIGRTIAIVDDVDNSDNSGSDGDSSTGDDSGSDDGSDDDNSGSDDGSDDDNSGSGSDDDSDDDNSGSGSDDEDDSESDDSDSDSDDDSDSDSEDDSDGDRPRLRDD